MYKRFRKFDVRFSVCNGRLVRGVTAADGRAYAHRCTREIYAAVAEAMQSVGEEGATVDSLATGLNLPHAQVNVAVEFLKARGLLETHRRRNFPMSEAVLEDATAEFAALGQTS